MQAAETSKEATLAGRPREVVLILPTGTYRAGEYLAAASRLGLGVVTASERVQALAGRMGERFLEVPLDDPPRAAEAIVERARTVPLGAVIAVDDQGLLTAALAAERLGLPHSPPSAVRLTRDKAAMRRAFAAAEVPQPAFEVVEPGEPASVAEAAARIGPPVVVKPCGLSGSRGVIRSDSPAAAGRAAERIAGVLAAAGEAPGAPLVVERFVPGAEVALEGILSAGRLEVIAIFDKPDPLGGPYFEETLYVAPTALSSLAPALEQATARAVAALGLREGPVHAELRAWGRGVPEEMAAAGTGQPTPDGVVVLEVAARTIGGRCSKAMVLPGGATLEELVVARAAGVPAPSPRLAGPAGVLMIPIPRSGILAGVGGVEEARAVPGVTGVEITLPVGRPVQALPDGDRYLGFVFASAPQRAGVEAALREAMRLIEVRIEAAPASPAVPGSVAG